MFKNSKRVSCVLLFAFWMQATVAFAGTEPTAVKDIKDTYRHHVVFDLDNDIGKCFGGQIVEMENSDKKSVLRVDPGKTSKMLFDKETDDSAVDIFSFDFKTSSDQTSVYFELIDADAPVKSDDKSDFENEAQYYDRYGRVLWFQKKDMKVFATMDYADLFKMTDMDPGNWHHMDLVVDYNQPDHGRVFYYLDGKLLTMPAYINKWIGVEGERSGGAANFNAITDLLESFKICEGIRAINTGSTGNLELSNVKFFRMKNYGERIDKDYVQGYPEHIESWITLSNERLGSNFAGKNIKYTVKVSNPYNKRAELTFVSTVYNEEKKQEYMVTKTVSLDSGETTAVPIEFSVSNYGFYTIKTTGTDNLGGNGINVENGFSVFAKSDTVNPHSLLASNNMTFYGIAEYERGLDLYSEAGFGGTRDCIKWASFEKKKGEYEFRDYQKKIVVKTAENNMVNFMLLAYDNEKAGYAGSPPQTAESIKGYANYAMNLAKSMKEVLPKGAKMEFEVWNEYDHKPFNRDGASVENYIEMLKQTYSAIKWVDSNAKVWGGGGGLTYEWLDEFMKLGGYKYCDGLTFHPYAATSEAIVSYEKFLKHREVLKKYGQEDFPVCLSEIGWTSDVDDVQARRLVQFAIMIDGEVDSSIYYRHYMDQQNSVAENFFGILGPAHYTKSYPKEPITARASFLALAAFNKILNGATEKIKLNPEDEKITAYSFKAQDGDRIVACWSNYSIETQETVYLKTMRKIDGEYKEDIRFDYRNKNAPSKELSDRLFRNFELAIEDADGVVISDQFYEENTGTISDYLKEKLSNIAKEKNIPFLVDSRAFATRFKNIYVKCNNYELMKYCNADGNPENREDVISGSKNLSAITQSPVFITRNKEGTIIYDGEVFEVLTYPVRGEIDVTGAGDASNAGIIIGLSLGLTPAEAAKLACAVSSITIHKLGETGTATIKEITDLLEQEN